MYKAILLTICMLCNFSIAQEINFNVKQNWNNNNKMTIEKNGIKGQLELSKKDHIKFNTYKNKYQNKYRTNISINTRIGKFLLNK